MNHLCSKLSILLFATLLLFSCKSDNQSNNIMSSQEDDLSDNSNTKESKVSSYYLFPSPGDILNIINNEDLEYNKELLNPPENADEYIDSKSRTIHLGGYIADLAYIALFGIHEQAIEYLNTIQKLSQQSYINIESLNQKRIKNLLASKSFKDSLIITSNNSFFEMISYLESNKREDAVSIFSIGAFIESMYIATFLIDDYSPENELIIQISKQKDALTSLMAYAEENKKVDHTKYFALEEINQFLVIFNQFVLVQNAKGDMVISEKDFKLFKQAIKQLRNRLIN